VVDIGAQPHDNVYPAAGGFASSRSTPLDLETSKKKVAALTEPRNAVVIGVSDRPGSWATRAWRNLKR
jgi:hypothetical protein